MRSTRALNFYVLKFAYMRVHLQCYAIFTSSLQRYSADSSVIFTLKRARNSLSYVVCNCTIFSAALLERKCKCSNLHSSMLCESAVKSQKLTRAFHASTIWRIQTFFSIFKNFHFPLICIFLTVFFVFVHGCVSTFFHPRESLAYSLSCVCSAQLIWITNIKIEFLLVLTCFPCYFPSLFSQI